MKIKITYSIIIGLFLSCHPINAVQSYGNVTVNKIIHVYDGDTFRCDINGYNAILGKNIGIRISGVDTPEMRDKNNRYLANKAKNFTRKKLMSAKIIELRNMRRGKYFRIVADVYVDDKNLGDLLIENHLANPYDGGTKAKW